MITIPAALTKEQQDSAKRYILKNHIYKMMAYVFVFMGLLVFIILYTKFVQGDVTRFLREPFLLLMIFSPFIPTLIMLHLSQRARLKASQIIKQAQADAPPKGTPKTS